MLLTGIGIHPEFRRMVLRPINQSKPTRRDFDLIGLQCLANRRPHKRENR
jgi:hypothetical protein